MSSYDKQLLRKSLLENEFDCYVLFTLSGKETDLALEMNGKYEDLYSRLSQRERSP